MTTHDEREPAFLRRLRELSDDPTVREFALELLPEPERDRLLAFEATQTALPTERLRAIYVASFRRARVECALAAAKRAGLRVLEATEDLAADVGRWFRDALSERRPARAHFGGSGASLVKVVVESLDGQESEFEGTHQAPPRWLGGRTLAVEVRVDKALAQFRGWQQAETLIRLKAGDGGADLMVQRSGDVAGNAPTRAECTGEHCVLVYEFTFSKRGGAAEARQAVDPDSIREIRLLPVPV